MRVKQFSILLLFVGSLAFSQEKMPYKIYTSSGKPITYAKMLKEIAKSEIVLFGEHHDNSIIHWLQLSLVKDLQPQTNLIIGAEMIEADNQSALNKYLDGEINQQQFDTTARLWPNYKTDYKPIVDFAKQHKIPFTATNVPRRFANMVYKGGFERLEVLSAEEKSWIAPLPILYDPNLPGYRKILEEMGGHGGDNLPKAQALKDATMAYFIVQNIRTNSIFVHLNGTYHSDNYEGIFWYLKQQLPKLIITTIATVEQKDLTFLKENYNKADFIIVTDQDVTKTH